MDLRALKTCRHSHFQNFVSHYVPSDWACKQNAWAFWVQSNKRWRADMLLWREDVCIALEAQRSNYMLDQRTEAYLSDGVIPIWLFVRIPKLLQTTPVFSVADLPTLGSILDAVALLAPTLHKTRSWNDYCKALSPVAEQHRKPELPLPPLPRKRSYAAGYRDGFAAGKAAGQQPRSARKELNLEAALQNLTFQGLIDIGLIDKRGQLIRNRRLGPTTLGALALQNGER